MTIIEKLKIDTDDKVIKSILIDGSHINIVLLDRNKIFTYKNFGKLFDILVVQFKHDNNIVSQAFYKTKDYLKDTWVPFDGIKGDVDDNNVFYKYMDRNFFEEDSPFGTEAMMSISYILGGGIWAHRDQKIKNILKLRLRMSALSNIDRIDVNFEDSIVVNHYINYSISSNYFKETPYYSKWVNSSTNSQKLLSAFDFSTKMENIHQIEYTPPSFPKFNSRDDYKDFYKKINKSVVKIPSKSSTCVIL